jgi:pyrimidine operon attenuation protein / uracil phosphoribosyltransferase
MTTHVPGSAGSIRPGSVEASTTTLLDSESISKALARIAHELIEDGLDDLALVGIQTRGVPLASRLRRLVAERSDVELPTGALDITFHRDDVHVRDGGRAATAQAPNPLARIPGARGSFGGRQPVVRATSIPFPIEGLTVVLVDDVLYTGRTIRAAIDALLEYGRPARVQLAVLVDRGHRELPIRPDYVGKNLPTARSERIKVELVEVDEIDRVLLVRESAEGDGA